MPFKLHFAAFFICGVKMSKSNLYWFIAFWIAFTCLNIYISLAKPNEVMVAQREAEKAANEPARQNEPLYIQLLTKLQNEKCSVVSDKESNSFYTCTDGTKASMIHWTRGNDRKGVVTREYDPTGKLILIYGHPDDVY